MACPYCSDSGWEYFTDDNGERRVKKCRCGLIDKSIYEDRVRFADIPLVYKDANIREFSHLEYKDATNMALADQVKKITNYWFKHREEMIEEGQGLYISSVTKGSGKTRFMAGLANELLHRYKMQVKFITSLQILSEIKESWRNNDDVSEVEIINRLSDVEVLFIDDFGTEDGEKDWIKDRFYQLINDRYLNNKPTFFTSNHPLDELNYDERIKSRIEEKCIEIHFPEESIRTKLKNEMLIRVINEQ